MLVNLTLKELQESFGDLEAVFKKASVAPFNNISYRPAYMKGQRQMTFTNLVKKHRGLPYNPGKELPDESEYVAVITLSHVFNGYGPYHHNVKPYEFKIREDGAIYYKIGAEYYKQPIAKWVKLISRFICDLPSFGPYLRQMQRTEAFKHELICRSLEDPMLMLDSD
jgi:hypothetical protein